ncbi:hypothetical protein VST45_09690, partial [Pseudomonas aeruginosa]
MSEQILLRAAGATQTLAGTSDKDFGAWWAGTPYGDDPVDQIWIKAGRRQKLSATPDLSGTVLPLCLIPNSA